MIKQKNGENAELDAKDIEKREALRLYLALKAIAAQGCDAEVKSVKGSFKVLKVKKTDPVIFNINN
jgi:hypothetical protein